MMWMFVLPPTRGSWGGRAALNPGPEYTRSPAADVKSPGNGFNGKELQSRRRAGAGRRLPEWQPRSGGQVIAAPTTWEARGHDPRDQGPSNRAWRGAPSRNPVLMEPLIVTFSRMRGCRDRVNTTSVSRPWWRKNA